MDNIFEKAKKISLVDFCLNNNFPITRQNLQGFASSFCPLCGQSARQNSTRFQFDDTVWYCFACGEGGDIITLVQKIKNCSPKEAAKWLLEEWQGKPLFNYKKINKRTPEEISRIQKMRLQVIKLLLAQADDSRLDCWQYLVRERKISRTVVKKALAARIIYFMSPLSNISYEMLKEAEMLDQKTGRLHKKYIKRPILTPFFKEKKIIGVEFRLARTPRKRDEQEEVKTLALNKKSLLWWSGKNKKIVAVVEGLIDLLSLATMKWDGCILGLPATSMWKKSLYPLSKLKDAEIFLLLDNDKAGRIATSKMLEVLPYLYNAGEFLPEDKDLNDCLKEGCENWQDLFKLKSKKQKVI